MDRSRRERAARLLAQVGDQLPRAFVGHPRGLPWTDVSVDPDWWRGTNRLVLPRPDALDHWEATRMGDPWAFVDLGPGGAALGVQTEGSQGLERIERVLRSEHATRVESFLQAAARMEESAVSAAVRVRLRGDGRWDEQVIDGRSVATASLGRGLLGALVASARAADDGTLGGPTGTAGVRVARVPVDETDPVDLRRAAKRLVALWRPLWGVPVPRPRVKKGDLDARLEAAYRRSLRLIAGRMGPAERAALRIEVRELQAAYREAGLARPRLLDVVSERLGLL